MSTISTCEVCGGSIFSYMRYAKEDNSGWEYDGLRDFKASTCRCPDVWNLEKIKEDLDELEHLQIFGEVKNTTTTDKVLEKIKEAKPKPKVDGEVWTANILGAWAIALIIITLIILF